MARYRGFVSAEKILSELGAEATAAAKGALRDSIHKRLRRKDGSIWRIAADAESSDGVFYGTLVEFSPRINRPFLYPALDAKKDGIRSAIVDAVRMTIRRRGK